MNSPTIAYLNITMSFIQIYIFHELHRGTEFLRRTKRERTQVIQKQEDMSTLRMEVSEYLLSNFRQLYFFSHLPLNPYSFRSNKIVLILCHFQNQLYQLQYFQCASLSSPPSDYSTIPWIIKGIYYYFKK